MMKETVTVKTEKAQAVINYNVTDAALADLKDRHVELIKAGPIDGDHERLELVKDGLRETLKLRQGVETKKSELNTDAKDWVKRVNDEAKRILAGIAETEDPLKAMKKAESERVEAAKAAKAKAEEDRKDAIRAKINTIRDIPRAGADLETMKGELQKRKALMIDDMVFQEFTAEADFANEEACRQLMEAIAERETFEAEKAALMERARKADEEEAERKRLQLIEDEERRKQQERDESERKLGEEERKRLQDIEDERRRDEAHQLQEQLNEKKAHLEAEDAERQKKIDAGNAELKRREDEHDAKVERDRIQAEEKEKAERDAKEKTEREAREKKEAEEAAERKKRDDAAAAERAAALAPDKEKVTAWADAVWKVAESTPRVADAGIRTLLDEAHTTIFDAIADLNGAIGD